MQREAAAQLQLPGGRLENGQNRPVTRIVIWVYS